MVLFGDYKSEMISPSLPPKVVHRATFRAEVDDTAVHISYDQTGVHLPARYGLDVGDAAIQHWISATQWVTVYRAQNMSSISVVIGRAEHPNHLGNCGDAVASAIFLTVRGLEFFNSKTNARAIAPPWTAAGEPNSLIHLAKYYYSDDQDESVVAGQFVVARDLRSSWRRSPLLSVAYHDPVSAKQKAQQIRALPVDFVSGDFRLGPITNLSGYKFAMFGEFGTYKHPKRGETLPEAAAIPQHARIDTVRITRREQLSLPIEAFPILEGDIQVEDRRLFDRETRVLQGVFRTNRFDSMAIAPQAKSDFEEKKQRAQVLIRAKTRARLFGRLLVAVVLLLPIYAFFKWKTLRTATKSNSAEVPLSTNSSSLSS